MYNAIICRYHEIAIKGNNRNMFEKQMVTNLRYLLQAIDNLKIAKKTKAYKLVPTKLVANTPDLTKFALGARSKKRLALYNEYLSVRNKQYLDWAIEQMICWKRDSIVDGVVHIHGSKDAVFPIKNIKNAIVVEGGTHVMLVYNAKAVSQQLITFFKK